MTIGCDCSGCMYNAAKPGAMIAKMLKMNNLPLLLPENEVLHCTLKEDGSFTIQLKNPVTPEIHGYPAYFSTDISGVLEDGRVKNLKGVKVFFMMAWLSIDTVLNSSCGERVYFSSNYVYKGIPLTAFEGLWSTTKKLVMRSPVYDLLMVMNNNKTRAC